MRRKVTKPRQAMSARQVDRVEKELRILLSRAGSLRLDSYDFRQFAYRRLERLLRMVRGSETR